MPLLPKLPLVTILCAALVLAAPLARGDSPAQTSSMPSPIEREFWEATRQIGSVPAYQAYLSRFPNGFYALLASAAIKKADNTVPSSDQARSRPTEGHRDSPSDAANAQLFGSKIAGPTNSRAIAQQAGDVFRGPGPITVGWMGARKQIVVPRGDWVLLAANDGFSSHTLSVTTATRVLLSGPTTTMAVTTLVLARLEGRMVRSLLLARFNSRPGDSRNSWADALACEATSPSKLFAWLERGSGITQCVEASLYTHTPTTVAGTFSGTIWEEALQKLAAGGGALPSSSFLVTDMFYTGDSSNYLKISRVDFGVSSGERDSGVANASLDLSLQGRERWAKAYSALAALGYRKKLSEEELNAGGSPTISATLFPD